MYQQLLVGRYKGTNGALTLQHANAVTAVAEVQEELVNAFCIRTPRDGWCPRHAIALVPRIRRPPAAEFLRVDGAVERPVHQVVGREHHYRLDLAVVVFALLAIGNKLLVVVRAIHIQTAVILQCRRVGTEDVGADGIVVTAPLVVGSHCLRISQNACCHEDSCHE